MSAQILNAFTVDVEDYFQVSAFEKHVSRNRWNDYESRVERNTHRILDLLNAYQVPATFFVVGWIARQYPRLVRDIHRAGHEIGSHSYWHRLVYELTPEEFRRDLMESRNVLEDVTGERVVAYRAPSFSITRQSLWALDILAQEGFTCDSSVFAIHHDRYGIHDAEPHLHELQTENGSLWEFPPSVVRVAGVNLPISGGGYFRLYPYSFTARCLSRVGRIAGRPFMFYVHPWEIDPEQPRLRAGTAVSRFRHHVNLTKTYAKLDRLLRDFPFGRARDVIDDRQAKTSLPLNVKAAVETS